MESIDNNYQKSRQRKAPKSAVLNLDFKIIASVNTRIDGYRRPKWLKSRTLIRVRLHIDVIVVLITQHSSLFSKEELKAIFDRQYLENYKNARFLK